MSTANKYGSWAIPDLLLGIYYLSKRYTATIHKVCDPPEEQRTGYELLLDQIATICSAHQDCKTAATAWQVGSQVNELTILLAIDSVPSTNLLHTEIEGFLRSIYRLARRDASSMTKEDVICQAYSFGYATIHDQISSSWYSEIKEEIHKRFGALTREEDQAGTSSKNSECDALEDQLEDVVAFVRSHSELTGTDCAEFHFKCLHVMQMIRDKLATNLEAEQILCLSMVTDVMNFSEAVEMVTSEKFLRGSPLKKFETLRVIWVPDCAQPLSAQLDKNRIYSLLLKHSERNPSTSWEEFLRRVLEFEVPPTLEKKGDHYVADRSHCHPESLLVHYITENDYTTEPYIGTSADTCALCSSYMDAINLVYEFDPEFTIRFPREDFTFPSSLPPMPPEVYQIVQDDLVEYLITDAKYLLKDYEARARSKKCSVLEPTDDDHSKYTDT